MLHLIVKENVILKISKKYTICELSICFFIYFWFRNNSFQLLIAFYGNNKNMSNNESIYFNKYFSLCTIDGVESLLLKKFVRIFVIYSDVWNKCPNIRIRVSEKTMDIRAFFSVPFNRLQCRYYFQIFQEFCRFYPFINILLNIIWLLSGQGKIFIQIKKN